MPPLVASIALLVLSGAATAGDPLDYRVSWVGNSIPGANCQWVQNFFIHANVRPDGSVVTWSHWDEGGKRFGVYRDGMVVGDEDVGANSLEATDRRGRTWTLRVRYLDPEHNEYDFEPEGITCDGKPVTFPGLHCPTALALANDGTLMVADSGTGPRQQVLFYDISDPEHPKLVRAFGEYGGITAGEPGVVTPTKFWGIRGIGMDAEGGLYVAMSEMGTVLRKFTPGGDLAWQLHGHFFVDVACATQPPTARTCGASRSTTGWTTAARRARRPSGSATRWPGTGTRTTRAG